MVLKSSETDKKLQRHIGGAECEGYFDAVALSLSQDAPVSFKRDLRCLVEALSRYIDASVASPRLSYPQRVDALTYLCLSIGQDPELDGRLRYYFDTPEYLCFDVGINYYNALVKRLSLALDAPYLTRLYLRCPSPCGGLEFAYASGKLLEAKVTVAVKQLSKLDMKAKRAYIKINVEIEGIEDKEAVYGLLLLNTKRNIKSQRFALAPENSDHIQKTYELSYPLADLGPYKRADLGLLIQVRGHQSELGENGKTVVKEKISQLVLPVSANLVFEK